jgi:hypothetical protein
MRIGYVKSREVYKGEFGHPIPVKKMLWRRRSLFNATTAYYNLQILLGASKFLPMQKS